MKSITLILLLIFNLATAEAAKNAIVKANVVRGESFVTANTSPEEIESIFKDALARKGFQVVEEIRSDGDIFYGDIFVFQFPADFPTVSITIRTESGIHFIDKESVKFFGDRNAANLKLALKLAERLPTDIDPTTFYEVKWNDLLGNSRISAIGLTSSAITKGYRTNYSSKIDWLDNEAPNFIIPDEFDNYFAFSSNYQGIRKRLKGKEITLRLKINQKARFELLDIDSLINLNDKQKNMLKEFVNGFPLWAIRDQIGNIEMKLGIK